MNAYIWTSRCHVIIWRVLIGSVSVVRDEKQRDVVPIPSRQTTSEIQRRYTYTNIVAGEAFGRRYKQMPVTQPNIRSICCLQTIELC